LHYHRSRGDLQRHNRHLKRLEDARQSIIRGEQRRDDEERKQYEDAQLVRLSVVPRKL
jgi:hypothetical protein